MAVFGLILYMIVALAVIWWVLNQAKRLDQAHGSGEHGQEHHHGEGDDLTRINGIGPVLAPKLNALGIKTFQQIAALTRADIDRINTDLDFKGRIEREGWVEQARKLMGSGKG